MTKCNVAFLAAVMAATVGATEDAHADAPDAGSDAGMCSAAQVTALQAQAQQPGLSHSQMSAVITALEGCEARAAHAEGDLAECSAVEGVLWTQLDACLRGAPARAITTDECRRLCTGRGGRWEHEACSCIEGFHPASPNRRTPAAVAACICEEDAGTVPPRPRPRPHPTTVTPPTPIPQRVEVLCPPHAVNIRGEDMSGRVAPANDRDCDGWTDDRDNAPDFNNPLQRDWDLDGVGDCDRDHDGSSDCSRADGCNPDTSDGNESDCDSELTDVCSANDDFRSQRAVCRELAQLRIELERHTHPAVDIRIAMRDVCHRHGVDQQIPLCRRLDHLEDVTSDHETRLDTIEPQVRCLLDGEHIWVDDRCVEKPPTAGSFQMLRVAIIGGWFADRIDAGLEAEAAWLIRGRLSFIGIASFTMGPEGGNGDHVDQYLRGAIGGSVLVTDPASRAIQVYLAGGFWGMTGNRFEEGSLAVFNAGGGFLQAELFAGRTTGPSFAIGLRLLVGAADGRDTPEVTSEGFQLTLGIRW